MKVFEDPQEEAHVWELRESGLGATAHVPNGPTAWPGWEDAAVPPARLDEYLKDFSALLDEHGYRAALYGHFGDGCVHCRIDFDLTTRDGIDRYEAFVGAAADLVAGYGGSFSGEHGDGQARGWLLPRMYGEDLVQAFREFKRLWDPSGHMNPGKGVDAAPPDVHLRLGTDYAPNTGKTHFAYKDDGGRFSNAILRCVGVGKCRRPDDAFMCPSYVATRDERDTTRGRARALFEMARGGAAQDGWRSRGVKDALDLCLGCKECKSECPVNVDMATYKSEFLAHHYAWRLRPRAAYAMGLIGWWARLAMVAPRLVNWLARTRPWSTLLKWMAGVAQARRMPVFARRSFSREYNDFEGDPGGRPVVLLPDVFNDCFHPEALAAAARVLARLGHRVIIARRLPAVRPAIHFGMLRRARRGLAKVVRELAPYARDGVPLVGLEPSTVSALREELVALRPDDQDAVRVAGHAQLLSELLMRDGRLALPRLGGRALLHAHCHARAVLDEGAARGVLERMGVEVDEPWGSCCGMAEAFGLEAAHYEVSQTIGEQALLPAVRDAGAETLIVVEGFSCRMQIAEGSERTPIHLAEAVDLAQRRDRTRRRRD